VSDITKKIFSIESEGSVNTSESASSDIIRPVLVDSDEPRVKSDKNDMPKFVTRGAVQPLTSPPSLSAADINGNSSRAGWVLLGFGALYLIGAGLYFGLPLLKTPAGTSTELISIAGLILLLALPVMLLFLLWRALRHLNELNLQNARFSKAAEILVSPEGEALARTKTLATGIQSEISKVNNSFGGMVDALKGVQLAMAQESQALDAAGLKLTNRSDDVGRNLTLQRQALESISGTFDTRMETLSTQISDTSKTLDSICTSAEEKLLNAGEALQLASGKMDQTIADSSNRISEKITEIGEVSRKLDETSTELTADLETSTQQLTGADEGLLVRSQEMQELNISTQGKISDLHHLIKDGNEMLANLREEAETRASTVQSFYQNLSTQLKQSENETLAAQGKTARMVESNLAQMRSDFSIMESDLQDLQTKLNDLKIATSPAVMADKTHQTRLKFEPLDSDFPPIEAPRLASEPSVSATLASPLNLGMDMEIKSPEAEIVGFEPDAPEPIETDVIRRPGDTGRASKAKGFGRRSDKQDKSGWRWRDVLGTLDRPDATLDPSSGLRGQQTAKVTSSTPESIDAVGILTMLQLSPSAIVDEGTVVDATQARINTGESGLVTSVAEKLPEAVGHLKGKISGNPQLAGNLKRFCDDFSNMIGNTPPTAPALRAALGSPEGRAYLIAVTALKG